ncbi:MAG: NADH-quinone oxidoreductase subunit L [Verrucomicrobiota bacterium]|nr:NADH-quinone oxidoreductase subunit L [Verrucomicrobiota bacterium]
MAEYLWLIPVAPLVVSLIILSVGKTDGRSAAALAILGQAIALTLAIIAFIPTLAAPGSRSVHNFTWFIFGDQAVRVGWVLDPLTAAMLLMITFVALWIFVFSVGYMADDKNFSRFFAYLSFFTAAMLGVVIANSLLLLFVCWELVGLASYLLIGFWIERPSAAAAAKKAFITTRIGDMGFFLGLLWLYGGTGTTLFYDNGAGCLETHALALIRTSATGIALLIFCGAAGKSGQFPLHVWLPDAMEGPTPVSALIHAATMVAAGVFLVARVYPLFSLGAINGVTPSLSVVVWIGVATALMASLIAIAQYDIKRILAYSTVSQLGLMMVSLGVGGVPAGIMHLIAHGFFKALLFLGAGSVIHGTHHEQDIRKMGGLRGVMPVTFITYAIGMMALSGVPLLFAGAWTKEEIMHATAHWPVSRIPFYLTMAGVVLTGFYMTRQMIYVFWRSRGAASEHAHESPRVMTLPLLVLATGTIALSFVLTPAWPWLHDYLSGTPVRAEFANLIGPMLFVSLALVVAGLGLGWWMYRKVGDTDPLAQRQPTLFRFLENRMWIDEFYARTIIAAARSAARIAEWMDRAVWDGLARSVGGVSQVLGILTQGLDERGINATGDRAGISARGFGRVISLFHSGQIQAYLAVIAMSMVGLLFLYAWLG